MVLRATDIGDRVPGRARSHHEMYPELRAPPRQQAGPKGDCRRYVERRSTANVGTAPRGSVSELPVTVSGIIWFVMRRRRESGRDHPRRFGEGAGGPDAGMLRGRSQSRLPPLTRPSPRGGRPSPTAPETQAQTWDAPLECHRPVATPAGAPYMPAQVSVRCRDSTAKLFQRRAFAARAPRGRRCRPWSVVAELAAQHVRPRFVATNLD